MKRLLIIFIFILLSQPAIAGVFNHNHLLCTPDHFHSYPYCPTPGCQVPCYHSAVFCPLINVQIPVIPNWYIATMSLYTVQQCAFLYDQCLLFTHPAYWSACTRSYFNCMGYYPPLFLW